MRCNLCVVLAGMVSLICLPTVVTADPIPGRDVLKFVQRPMVNTTIPGPNGPVVFHGHDELSTAWGMPDPASNFVPHYEGTFMADDFADHFDSPVVHVKWWGSYLNRPTNLPPERQQVRQFLISFENDVPATAAGGFSHPGEEKFNQIVRLDADGVLTKGEGTFTEREISPISVDGPIYEYNAELHLDKAFREKAETVYWLKIVALDQIPSLTIPLDQRLQWGWHNRDYTVKDPLASTPPAVSPGEYVDGFLPVPGAEIPIWHFQDDAVTGRVGVDMIATRPIMPNVFQDQFERTFYRAPSDGPSLIASPPHSKDLAFALYTIPEPGTLALVLLAWLGIALAPSRCRR